MGAWGTENTVNSASLGCVEPKTEDEPVREMEGGQEKQQDFPSSSSRLTSARSGQLSLSRVSPPPSAHSTQHQPGRSKAEKAPAAPQYVAKKKKKKVTGTIRDATIYSIQSCEVWAEKKAQSSCPGDRLRIKHCEASTQPTRLTSATSTFTHPSSSAKGTRVEGRRTRGTVDQHSFLRGFPPLVSHSMGD